MFVTGESIIGAGMRTGLRLIGVTAIGLPLVGVLACGLSMLALRVLMVTTRLMALAMVSFYELVWSTLHTLRTHKSFSGEKGVA